MKYLLRLLLTFSICFNILKGQDIEPSQRKFYLNGDIIYIISELDDFKISNFILGWHWGDQYKISQAFN